MAPLARQVQGTGRQFFAGAGFAGYQDGGTPGGHYSNDVADLAHFVALANQQALPLFAGGVLREPDQVAGFTLFPHLIDESHGFVIGREELAGALPGQADGVGEGSGRVVDQNRYAWGRPLYSFQHFHRTVARRRKIQYDGHRSVSRHLRQNLVGTGFYLIVHR
jgi:hypothetical protein